MFLYKLWSVWTFGFFPFGYFDEWIIPLSVEIKIYHIPDNLNLPRDQKSSLSYQNIRPTSQTFYRKEINSLKNYIYEIISQGSIFMNAFLSNVKSKLI